MMRNTLVSNPILTALLVCLGAFTTASGMDLYVAPDGDDANAGTQDQPFATVHGARDAIRAMKSADGLPKGGVTVHVAEGTYFLKETLELTGQDSGEPDAPVVYRAEDGKEVRLTGGMEVEGFRPVEDAVILSRVPEEAHGKLLVTDLREQGITDFGQLTPRGFGRPKHPAALELFFNDEPMPLAQWPNTGWTTIKGAPAGKEGGKFSYEGERPRRWMTAEEAWLHGYWTWDWADSYVKVREIKPEEHLIETVPPHGAYGYTPGKRFRALNLLEELDSPGEWYLNRDDGNLYFWPPAAIESGRAVVSVTERLVTLEDTKYITILGFTFEACRGVAVTIKGGERNKVAGCRIRNTGTAAAGISGGTNNGLTGCDLYNCDEGLWVSGGDRKTLTPCHNYVVNNHIHHYGRWCKTYRPAAGVNGVGIRVAHNLIHDAPHNGIQLGGNDNLIEFNELYAICQDTGDVGAYYMGRDWTMRGNVVRHNFFHNIHGPYTHGAMAVYLDDCASGTTIYGNVFYKASRAAFIGGGRDNVVDNNIFVDCHPAIHIDSRALGWAKEHAKPGGAWHMYEKLEAVNHDEPPYSEKYPPLTTLLQDEPPVPKNNVLVRNLIVGGKGYNLSPEGREHARIENNLVAEEVDFANPAELDFSLPASSPVYDEIPGFKPIPFDKIGLYEDEYRGEIPTRPAAAELEGDSAKE